MRLVSVLMLAVALAPLLVRGPFVTSPRADWALEAYSSVSMAAAGVSFESGVFVARGA